jgi:hypothetical protein
LYPVISSAIHDLPEGALFFRKPYRSDEIISTLRKLAA